MILEPNKTLNNDIFLTCKIDYTSFKKTVKKLVSFNSDYVKMEFTNNALTFITVNDRKTDVAFVKLRYNTILNGLDTFELNIDIKEIHEFLSLFDFNNFNKFINYDLNDDNHNISAEIVVCKQNLLDSGRKNGILKLTNNLNSIGEHTITNYHVDLNYKIPTNIKFDYMISFSSTQFENLYNKILKFGECVEINCDENTISFEISNQNTKFIFNYLHSAENNVDDDSKTVKIIKNNIAPEDVKVKEKFKLSEKNNINKFTDTSNTVELFLKNGHPMFIRHNIYDMGSCAVGIMNV